MRLTYDPDQDLLDIRLGDSAVAIQVARASEFVDLTSLDITGLPVSEASVANRHIVRPGDTLSAIAAANGVSVDALVAANNLDDPDVITVGQALTIPAS